MAILFPSSLDNLTNPTAANPLNSPSHSGQHSDENDAIEAIEAKIGVDSSAVASSLDYLIKSSSDPGHLHSVYLKLDQTTPQTIINGRPVFVEGVTVGSAGTSTGSILLKGTTSGTVTLKVADAAGTYNFILPTNDGDSGQVLITDGFGNTSWSSTGFELASNKVTSISGASTDVQYPSAKLLYDQLALKLDEKAKVSSNDTTSGYLNGKLIAGTGVLLTENGDGGNETLGVSYDPSVLYNQDEVNMLVTGVNFDYFLSNTVTGEAAPIDTYKLMYPSSVGGAGATINTSVTGDDVLIAAWITETTEPAFTILSEGVYHFHSHFSVNSVLGVFRARTYWTLSKRTAAGVETLLTTSEMSDQITASEAEYETHGVLNAEEILLSDDRLVFKLYANQDTGGGGNPTLTTYIEGVSATRISVETVISALDNRYVGKDLFDANTILKADADNVPEALTVGVQTVVGRATGGEITALAIDSDLSSVSANDDTLPSAKATKAALDLKAPLISPTFATSITGSYLTASEILGTDGSKNIVSLPVATYPSLTELSYVKGLSSAIQTQLGTKAIATTTITVAGTANQITSSAGAQDLSANRTWTLSLPADVLIPTILTSPNTGLHILDTNASHDLIIKPGSDLTADRTLTLTTGDTDMIVNLTATTDEYVLAYDVATNTWRGVAAGTGAGDVSAALNLTDNAIVRGDGGAKGVQTSSVLIDDSNNVSGIGTLGAGAITTTGVLTGTVGGVALDIQNTTDAASNQVAKFHAGNRAIPAGNDKGYISLMGDDDTGTQQEFARITWEMDAVAADNKGGTIRFGTMSSNILSTKVYITGDDIFARSLSGSLSSGQYVDLTAAGDLGTTVGSLFGTTSLKSKLLINATTYTGTANYNLSSAYIGPKWTEAASGTHPIIAGLIIRTPDITAGAGATTNTAGLYLEGASAIGTNNYTLWADAGEVRIDGDIGDTTNRVAKLWATDIESNNIPTVGGTALLTSLTAPQFTTIELGAASDCTIARVGAGQISVETVVVPTVSSTNTLTNKRITQRVVTTTDDATAVIDVDTTDVYELSAVANATTFSTTGTPTDGQKLIIRFKDAGGAKGLTWDAIFVAIGVTAPTTTVAGKWHYVGATYNTAATKWHIIATGVEA